MTERIKILYVITKSNWGGAQRYVYDLATTLSSEQFEVVVVVGSDGILVDKLRSAHVRVISIKSLDRDVSLGKDWKAFLELRSIFKKERPHVVHLNSSKAGGLGGLAARVTHMPRVIFTAHGWAFNECRPAWQRVALYISYITAIILADRTICVSNAVFRDVHSAPGISYKLQVIPLGITSPAYKTREEAREHLAQNDTKRRLIGMVSELHPTKRVEDAIVAVEKLKEKYPDILLLVAGEGEYRSFLEKEIERLGVREHVRLLGFVPDISTYLKAFDVFLFPSRTEALGYALLEAGDAALPVVATRVGGIPEVITDEASGLLIAPEKPSQLAKAIGRIFDDPDLRKRLGATIVKRVHNGFVFKRMIANTSALYHH